MHKAADEFVVHCFACNSHELMALNEQQYGLSFNYAFMSLFICLQTTLISAKLTFY